jgi:hypothetical protein
MSICRCSSQGRGRNFLPPPPSLPAYVYAGKRAGGSGVTPMLAQWPQPPRATAHGMAAAPCVILIDLVIQIVSWLPRLFLCFCAS